MLGQPTCVEDSAYISASASQAAAIIQQAATQVAIQTAVGIAQRLASDSIANMQDAVAKEQMRMAELLFAHTKKFWNAKRFLAQDIFNYAKQNNEYTSLPNGWGQIAVENLNEGREDWLEEQDRILCSTPSRCEDIRWLRNATAMRADMRNFAARQGEARVQALNDWRYELQTSALAMGQQAFKEYKTFSDIYRSASTSAGEMLAGGINATMGALGYFTTPKPFDYWGSGIRKELNTAYAPTTAQQSKSVTQTNLDFNTPRIAALTQKPAAEGLQVKPEASTKKNEGYWSTPWSTR